MRDSDGDGVRVSVPRTRNGSVSVCVCLTINRRHFYYCCFVAICPTFYQIALIGRDVTGCFVKSIRLSMFSIFFVIF